MALRSGLRCTVCTHPKRSEIDRALVGGTSDRAVAADYSLARSSVQRHKLAHVMRAVTAAVRATEAVERSERVAEAVVGASTLDRIEELTRKGLELLALACGKRDENGNLVRQRYAGDPDGADLKGAAAMFTASTRALETIAKLRGEIQPSTVNVLVDQRGKPREEWATVLGVLLEALRPYPDAARAVAQALRQVEGPVVVEAEES